MVFLEEPPSLDEAVASIVGPAIVVGLFSGEGLHGAKDAPKLSPCLRRRRYAGLVQEIDRAARSVVCRLKVVSSSSLTIEFFKKGLRQCFLVGLVPMNRNAVHSFTMRMIPAREDLDTIETLTPHPNPDNLQWEAVESIPPGHVLVIDSPNDPRAASAGAMLPTRIEGARGSRDRDR